MGWEDRASPDASYVIEALYAINTSLQSLERAVCGQTEALYLQAALQMELSDSIVGEEAIAKAMRRLGSASLLATRRLAAGVGASDDN